MLMKGEELDSKRGEVNEVDATEAHGLVDGAQLAELVIQPTQRRQSRRRNRRTMKNLKEWLKDISLPVYILTILFALSSWVDINGMWVQLPLFVNRLPEGWDLPSFLVIIMQVGNVGPLLYVIANRIAPNRIREWPVVYFIIIVGTVACILLAFFWDVTSVIGGEEHSTMLFLLSMFLALVDCTSTVVYLPYMSVFKPQYMTAYYIGDGLSGLIPGLVGLGQGVGGDPVCVNESSILYNTTTGENTTVWEVVQEELGEPNFSIQTFFFFLFALMCVSLISFTALNWAPFCKRETVSNQFSYEVNATSPVDPEKKEPEGPELQKSTEKLAVGSTNLQLTDFSTQTEKPRNRDEDGRDPNQPRLRTQEYAVLLLLALWINLLSIGIINSIQTYAALPYGSQAYSLSVRLGKISDPIACFLALLVPTMSFVKLAVLSGVGTAFMSYQIALASMSPSPPLQDHVAGETLCIVTAVLMVAVFSYTRVCISSILQQKGGRSALMWCGFITQVGVFIGALLMFICVNVLQVFERTPACADYSEG